MLRFNCWSFLAAVCLLLFMLGGTGCAPTAFVTTESSTVSAVEVVEDVVATAIPTLLPPTTTPTLVHTAVPVLPTVELPATAVVDTTSPPPAANDIPAPAAYLITRNIFESPAANARAIVETAYTNAPFIASDGLPYYFVRLTVELLDGNAESLLLVEEWRTHGLGLTVPGVLSWSHDGQSLFLTEVPQPDGCAYLFNGNGLTRYNFVTGEQTIILADGGRVLSVSPNEDKVAYYGREEIFVQDLSTGAVQTVALPEEVNWSAGPFLWSYDGHELIAELGVDICSGEAKTMLVRLQPEVNNTAVVLLPPDERQFQLQEWTNPDEVSLLDKDKQRWRLNLAGDLSGGAYATATIPPGVIGKTSDELWYIDHVGQKQTILSDFATGLFSPNGEWLAYRPADTQTILVRNLNNGVEQQVAHQFEEFHWLAWLDEAYLVLVSVRSTSEEEPSDVHLVLYDPSTGETQTLYEGTLFFLSPAIAPDGETVIFGQASVEILSLSSGEITRFNPAQFENWPYGRGVRLANPRWSPDGTQLAMVLAGPDVMGTGKWGAATAVFDLQENSAHIYHPYQNIGSGHWPSVQWSPDGQKLLVETHDVDRQRGGLWLINVTDDSEQYLGSNSAGGIWSPDSQQVIYHRHSFTEGSQTFLYDLSTQTTQQLNLLEEMHLLAWR